MALVALVSALLIPPTDSVLAFPRDTPSTFCQGNFDIDWSVSSTYQFAGSAEDAVFDGIDLWDDVLNSNGGKTINTRLTPHGTWTEWNEVLALKIGNLPGGALGLGLCDPNNFSFQDPGDPSNIYNGVVLIDPAAASNVLYVEDVAAHEFGHVAGLLHTGDDDSHDGNRPIMATCTSGVGDNSRTFSQDDEEGLVHRATNNAKSPMTANRSFETGTTKYWGKTGGSWSVIAHSGSKPASSGSDLLSWTPSSSTNYVYQTTNYADASGLQVDAIAAFKKLSTGSGRVTIQAWTRKVTYPLDPPCSYPTNKDQRVRMTVGGWVMETENDWSATTSWKVKAIPDFVVNTGDSQDLRIRIYSSVKSGSTYKPVGIDKARLRDENA